MPGPTEVDLEIEGMTCASCVARVEKRLNAIPGVEATVNLATERARVRTPDGVTIPDLVAAVQSAGYRAAPVEHPATVHETASTGAPEHIDGAGHEHGSVPERAAVRDLRQRLAVSAALSIPVVVLSMIPALQFPDWQWLALALAAPVAVWGAWPFHRVAAIGLRHGSVNMDTLVSVGVLAAFGWSLYALFFGDAGRTGMRMTVALFGRPEHASGEIYLEVACGVTVLILLGRWIEARAKRDAGDALRALASLAGRHAARVRGGVEERVPVSSLEPGDVVRVRPGERVPSDGVVRDGVSAIDASMLTGESVPIEAGPGTAVAGGMLNASGSLLVEITRTGADTELARIARLVEDAQTGKAAAQRLADRVSAVFVPIVIVLAVGAFVGWLVAGAALDVAFTAGVATLIIACPCALGLATPVALLVGTGRGSQLGILIRGPEALERARRVDTILLDKTGTLTTGRMRVTDVLALDGDERALLARLAAAEAGSEHPIAAAILEAADARGATLAAASEFEATPGGGVRAVVGGAHVLAGRPEWVAARLGSPHPREAAAAIDRIEAAGGTAAVVALDGVVAGVVGIADTLKPHAAEAVARLRGLGLRPVLLTGDNERAARAVAASVGIDDVRAGVDPAGKAAIVRSLHDGGRSVAMVGDGVNDAAALAEADLGISMGGGTDVALAASDLTIVSGDPIRIPDAVRLARRTLAVIRGNLFWAFAYNVAAIPLAIAGLLNPLVAGAAMAFSSVFVVLNSLRLRGFRAEQAADD